jgi:hypothetical protein
MSTKMEIAEIMSANGQMYDWAEKVSRGVELTAEEKDISTVVDAWAKEIGTKGKDTDNEIAEFIIKTISDPVYSKPDALIEKIFDTDSIGEFDDYIINKDPKNTLVAYDAAKGGNVFKSYIDSSALTPTWKHAQVETEISYAQLRRGGFKSIANMAVFAKEALDNKKIKDVFSILDTAVAGGEQVFTVTGNESALSKSVLDKLALYVIDHVADGEDAIMFGLNKYAQAIANMSGYTSFMSNDMKNDYNRYGLVKEYGGCLIGGFSGTRRAADGELLIPEKRIFGIAGKIGTICDRGDLRVYETLDNNKERVSLKFTGYEYGIKVTNPENVAKIAFND